MATLYVETNFFIGVATGRDSGAELLGRIGGSGLNLSVPSVCVMEALKWYEGEEVRRKDFDGKWAQQINELSRDANSPEARSLRTLLREAQVKNRELLLRMRSRLFGVIVGASASAEWIHLDAEILDLSRMHLLIGESTDNLILHCILAHASRSPGGPKALLTENTKDFGGEDVRRVLREAGVDRLFTNSAAAVGWHQSLSES